MEFSGLVALAFLVEAIIETVKMVFDQEVKARWPFVAAMVLGIVVAVVYGVDLFEWIGVEASIPYIGNVLTGIVFARGANYLSDLLGALKTKTWPAS